MPDKPRARSAVVIRFASGGYLRRWRAANKAFEVTMYLHDARRFKFWRKRAQDDSPVPAPKRHRRRGYRS